MKTISIPAKEKEEEEEEEEEEQEEEEAAAAEAAAKIKRTSFGEIVSFGKEVIPAEEAQKGKEELNQKLDT